jgi:hypothetical protein
MAATAADVAAWMFEELKRLRNFDQDHAAAQIERRFGKQFVYDNANGNPAISKDVLKHFNVLTKNTVVWSRSERYWRFRHPSDSPGRMQE